MASINTSRRSPPSSPSIAPDKSPKKLGHSFTFPLSLHHPKTPSSTSGSLTSKFQTLKDKVLSPQGSSATATLVKRTSSLKPTALRITSSIPRRNLGPGAAPVPTRKKGVSYAMDVAEVTSVDEPRDNNLVLPLSMHSLLPESVSSFTTTHSPISDQENAIPVPDRLTKLANATNPGYIPPELINGLPMMRITHKKRRLREFRIDPNTFELSWDSKASSRCSIDFIEDIREGEEAKYYRESLKVSSALSSRWATILYNFQKDNRSKPRLLHIVAQSMEDFRLFLGTLKRLALYRQAIGKVPGLPQEALLEDWNKRASPLANTSEEYVTIDGVQEILHKFYIYCSKRYISERFEAVNANGSGQLTFSEFEKLIQLLKARPEIKGIFDQHADLTLPCSGARGLSREALFAFCQNVQKITSTELELQRMFDKFSYEEDGCTAVVLDGFSQILLSETHMPFATSAIEDLTQPLTEYFISSSHNTYLVGRQLAGESSIEPYIQVLEDSCRCLEIDCWDGDDGPIVNHGRTFTSSVSFESVIEAINHYAFRSSSLPVILSLEIRCNVENQNKMVDIMKKHFEEKLVTEPLDNSGVVPSPLQLQNRILIKVKAAGSQNATFSSLTGSSGASINIVGSGNSNSNTGLIGGNSTNSKLGLSNFRASTGNSNGILSSSSMTTATATTTTTTTSTNTEGSEKEEDSRRLRSRRKNKETAALAAASDAKDLISTSASSASSASLSSSASSKRHISEKLGSLGVYLQGIKFRNFSLPVSKTYNHCFSLSELKINAMIKDMTAHAQLVKHNKKYFLRVYPSGYRVTSSNYDPIYYWKRGVQMVSINWQTYGKFLKVDKIELRV